VYEQRHKFCVFPATVAMETLDGDDVRLSSRGRFAERDIVQVKQFFPFEFLLCFDR